MKLLSFAGCLRISLFWILLVAGLAMTAHSQETRDQMSNANGEYLIDSSSQNDFDGLHEGMLMINGRTSLRFFESSYDGSMQADLVIAPRIYYFLSRSWAGGILFQYEHRFGEGEDLSVLGLGQGNEIFINLGNDRSYLNLDFAMLFLISGKDEGFMNFRYGAGFSQFITDEVAINGAVDIAYYLGGERDSFPLLGDELRFQIGISYFLRNLKGGSK